MQAVTNGASDREGAWGGLFSSELLKVRRASFIVSLQCLYLQLRYKFGELTVFPASEKDCVFQCQRTWTAASLLLVIATMLIRNKLIRMLYDIERRLEKHLFEPA